MTDPSRKDRARTVTALVLFIVASLVLTYRAHWMVDRMRGPDQEARIVGMLKRPAPDFSLEALTRGDTAAPEGSPAEIRLADYRGKIVLLSFWASWCRPCHMELPLLNQYYLAHRAQGVEVIAISTDEDREAALRYAETNRFAFPMVWDGKQTVGELYKVQSLPSLVIIGPDGRIHRYQEGVRYDLEAWLDRQLRELSKQGSDSDVTRGGS